MRPEKWSSFFYCIQSEPYDTRQIEAVCHVSRCGYEYACACFFLHECCAHVNYESTHTQQFRTALPTSTPATLEDGKRFLSTSWHHSNLVGTIALVANSLMATKRVPLLSLRSVFIYSGWFWNSLCPFNAKYTPRPVSLFSRICSAVQPDMFNWLLGWCYQHAFVLRPKNQLSPGSITKEKISQCSTHSHTHVYATLTHAGKISYQNWCAHMRHALNNLDGVGWSEFAIDKLLN